MPSMSNVEFHERSRAWSRVLYSRAGLTAQRQANSEVALAGDRLKMLISGTLARHVNLEGYW